MPSYILFNKPFQVLTQFTDPDGRATLADFIDTPDVYSAGRLDYDSEGLLLLTDDGALIHAMMNPKHKVAKTYYAQVEGIPDPQQLDKLMSGLELKDGLTLPCTASLVDSPEWLWDRTPPIRERKQKPTSWIKLSITEGKNRQVRRMTAAIGYPTLRLIRWSIGEITLSDLNSGNSKILSRDFIADNGINWKPKKSSPKAAHTKLNRAKRSDQPQRRSRQNQNRSQTNGKTQLGNQRSR
ncbi:pseudouridine synthase [Reinekea sp.]|uniref:pseudouridine synthase n=1 Tax=Reinekea sp. TaxID=1970455 RepID=UPI003989F67C